MEVIKKLLKEGKTVPQIRKETGFTAAIIYQEKRTMKNESRQLYSEGNTLRDIADTLNIHISRVKYYVYEVGPKPEIIHKEKLTELQQNRIRQLLICKDYTLHEIADEVGLKAKDISEFVKRG